jgi:hypothetical protein
MALLARFPRIGGKGKEVRIVYQVSSYLSRGNHPPNDSCGVIILISVRKRETKMNPHVPKST